LSSRQGFYGAVQSEPGWEVFAIWSVGELVAARRSGVVPIVHIVILPLDRETIFQFWAGLASAAAVTPVAFPFRQGI